MRIAVTLVLLAACKRPMGESMSSADASASASAVAVVDAAPAPPPAALVDLLRATPAVVAVSSNVDNPRDYPEHLVDGNMDTAWNGRTGDLHGWIAFSVPQDATVVRLELAAGYAKGDLFTKNYRLRRVRVTRASSDATEEAADAAQNTATVLTEAALDPERRELQTIELPAGTPGGRFRIEVLETVPGSEPKWRELVVSELRVLGTPGKTVRAKPTYPLVSVGALEQPGEDDGKLYTVTMQETEVSPPPAADWLKTLETLGVTYKSSAEFLRAWNERALPALEPHKKYLPTKFGGVDAGPLSATFRPTDEVKQIRKITLFGTSTEYTLIGVQSSRGFEVSEVPLDHDYYSDPGCFGGTTTTLVSVRAEPPRNESERAVVIVEQQRVWTNSRTFMDMEGKLVDIVYPQDKTHVRFECRLPVSATPMECAPHVVSRACGTVDEPIPCDSY